MRVDKIYRISVSGHYYPHEFREIITSLKPKKANPNTYRNARYNDKHL
jgi:DNA-binding PadR family transcriptional regulator